MLFTQQYYQLLSNIYNKPSTEAFVKHFLTKGLLKRLALGIYENWSQYALFTNIFVTENWIHMAHFLKGFKEMSKHFFNKKINGWNIFCGLNWNIFQEFHTNLIIGNISRNLPLPSCS